MDDDVDDLYQAYSFAPAVRYCACVKGAGIACW